LYLVPLSLSLPVVSVEAGYARDDTGRALSKTRLGVVIVITHRCNQVSNWAVAVSASSGHESDGIAVGRLDRESSPTRGPPWPYSVAGDRSWALARLLTLITPLQCQLSQRFVPKILQS